MKVKAIRAAWLERDGRRLDCNPYMSGALEAKDTLELLAVPKEHLRDITSGIFHAGREGRQWVDHPDYGVPFLGSTDILQADLSTLPLLSAKQVQGNPHFTIQSGWTLITRSGSIGRMAYARSDMAGMACSEHVLRVVANNAKVPSGYLYAFLSSKFGVPLIIGGTYGSVIQSIESIHIENLPVPRFGEVFEFEVHSLVDEAAHLLTQYQHGIRKATDDLFSSVGLRDIAPYEWHTWGTDTGFSMPAPNVYSLRALNFNPRFRRLDSSIRSVPHKTLGEICLPGTLARGGRFKRIDADPQHAYQLIGQKELFWLQPEGRWIAKTALGPGVLVDEGAVLVAAQGTLGETELFCRAEFVWGQAKERAYSEHILRVIADESVMPRGCLFAFMRSETAFRMLRSISVGTKLQDHHYAFKHQLPVPYPDRDTQLRIHRMVTEAYTAREQAVRLLNKARLRVEKRITGEE